MSSKLSHRASPVGDTEEARRLRQRLVASIAAFDQPWSAGDWDPRVLDALLHVPRHLFIPELDVVEAYRDIPQPIGFGQTISQPTVVALMSQALALTGEERVLEIGTGCGYQAAVLSKLAKSVHSLEIVPSLAHTAHNRLARLGCANVVVKVGDGYVGWPEAAPYDRILLTAAPPTMPMALVDQLADGGSIVAPIGELSQQLVRWVKRGDDLEETVLGAVRFVPMVPAAPNPAVSPDKPSSC